jgi:hypothetical protein
MSLYVDMQYKHINGHKKHVRRAAFDSSNDSSLTSTEKKEEILAVNQLVMTFSIMSFYYKTYQNTSVKNK